ncbi:FAD-dependent oxidoreductase [Bordetella avium]|uniref:Bifunctional protein: include phospholipase and oxidoreductase n=1 Tax=Bordetella avium (strain 197N) TaxID=360910 RepID=Q2L052_BORA1|nr:FAD-dependent oxidoreductase [Bordetella avium]AZY47930.1 pyridine nucleotide-disulfide oxidoreductase [Bordetella avium]AZY51300.1 pyridine nucleotide-disulfide oxidoreductase [Bordetella avium]RIQ35300.1 pyridine nucleotide-disulfide oxidoreductase [Bordetella avium]RIQ41309.1 pyridine nucleotide-disulfide oxidoreductase [Bordetella avium]RIQ45904.1 pyridine nucleotide-disulfide oxidoreductase [Bordetella avium]
MTYQDIDFLLVGGGLASAQAAETLRREGATGSILILSAESILPYHRPELSKRYLLGTTDAPRLLVHPESFYCKQNIDVALNTAAVSLDAGERLLTTASGSHIRYGQLLIATGATSRQLEVPGASLKGVLPLRSRDDCDVIRALIANASPKGLHAVVAGGSFLGMEVAMTLAKLGLKVTIVERSTQLLKHLASPLLSDVFRDHAQAAGITVVMNDPVIAFQGQDQVSEVLTEQGRRIPCDLAILCTGVKPATQFLESSEISLEDGWVQVDDRLESNVPGVFAAGDVASFFDPVFSRRRHIEHWDNAIKQGRLAAMNMLRRRQRYDEVSYFFCEIGDLGFDMLGDPTEDIDQTIARGTLQERSFSLFYLKEDIARAVFTLGRSADETRIAESLIRYRTKLSNEKEKLGHPGFALHGLPTQNVLILQGGGALGAFECGVVKALEECQIYPDIVAGISIGAVNGAIIASHPHNATAALEAFWSELEVASLQGAAEPMQRAIAVMQILQLGVDNFFRPRWIPSYDSPWEAPWNWTSFYDTAPMRRLLSKYVDFSSLKSSPVRLLVGAVNVLTAEFETFDSYVDDLTPDHILASGSLPPGFSWTFVDGKPYWDGGIVSNSPLDLVIDCCGPDGKRVFIVDLFASQKELPKNMVEIMARRDEIVYSERVRNDLRTRELIDAYRGMIENLLLEIEPQRRERIKRLPRYIQLMGNGTQTQITRFIRQGPPDEPSSRDYDFSDIAIRANQKQGYEQAKTILAASSSTARRPPDCGAGSLKDGANANQG